MQTRWSFNHPSGRGDTSVILGTFSLSWQKTVNYPRYIRSSFQSSGFSVTAHSASRGSIKVPKQSNLTLLCVVGAILIRGM